MLNDLEQCILDAPKSDTALTAVPCMVRLRGQGGTYEQIAAGLCAETGMVLTAAAVERILFRVAEQQEMLPSVDADPGRRSPAMPLISSTVHVAAS